MFRLRSLIDASLKAFNTNSTLVYLNLGRTNITATDPDTGRSLTSSEQMSLTHLNLS